MAFTEPGAALKAMGKEKAKGMIEFFLKFIWPFIALAWFIWAVTMIVKLVGWWFAKD